MDNALIGPDEESSPGRRILAAPWADEPVHLERAWQLLVEQSRAAMASPGPRVVPILLSAAELARLVEEPVAARANRLIEIVAQSVANHRERPEEDAARLKPVIEQHLRLGAIRLLLPGIADRDRALDEPGGGTFLSEDEATAVLDAVEWARVADVVVVARALDDGAGAPVVARWAMLERYGFTSPEWLEASSHWRHPLFRCMAQLDGVELDRFVPPSWWRQPLFEHLAQLLSAVDGPVWSQILSLQRIALYLDDSERFHDAIEYLFGVEDRSWNWPPRLPRAIQSNTEPAIIDEYALFWNALRPRVSGAGLLLLDPETPAGGWGKTESMMVLAARSLWAGRPALYFRLPELTRKLSDIKATLPNASLLEQLLEIATPMTQAAERAARAALMAERGTLLLLDGLDEVSDSRRFEACVDSLARLLCGEEAGVRALIACRAEAWGEHARKQVNAARERRQNELPAAARLWQALRERPSELPHEVTLLPFTLEAARAHLSSSSRHGQELLAALGDGLEALLPHPLMLGLLSGLRGPEFKELTRRREAQNDVLFLWDVVEVAIEGLVRRGLTGDSSKRPKEQPLGRKETDLARAMRYLDGLALAMAEYGGSLPAARVPEVIGEIIRRLDKEAIKAIADAEFVRFDARKLIGGSRDDFYRTLYEHAERDWTPSELGDLAIFLADLKAVSLILIRNAEGDWQMSHPLLRDVLATRALITLEKDDPAAMQRSEWMLSARRVPAGMVRVSSLRSSRRLTQSRAISDLRSDEIAQFLPVLWLRTLVESSLLGHDAREQHVAASLLVTGPLRAAADHGEWLSALLERCLREPRDLARRVDRATRMQLRMHLIDALKLTEPDVVKKLLPRFFTDSDPVVRAHAAHALNAAIAELSKRDPEWAKRALARLLADDADAVRRGGADALATAIPALLEHDSGWAITAAIALLDDAGAHVQLIGEQTLIRVAALLRAIDQRRATEMLEQLLNDPRASLRRVAGRAIAAAASPENEPTWIRIQLERLLTDPDEHVRAAGGQAIAAAAPALIARDTGWLKQAIDRLLNDESAAVRSAGGRAIEEAITPALRDRDWLCEMMLRLLRDPNANVHLTGESALRKVVTTPGAIDADWVTATLSQLMTDPEAPVRRVGRRAVATTAPLLVAADPGWLIATLTRLLGDSSPDARRAGGRGLEQALPALVAIDPEWSRDAIAGLLKDWDERVWETGAAALKRALQPPATPDPDWASATLQRLLDDRAEPARLAVAELFDTAGAILIEHDREWLRSALAQLIADPDPAIRRVAARRFSAMARGTGAALIRVDLEWVMETIARLLAHFDQDVREEGAEAFANAAPALLAADAAWFKRLIGQLMVDPDGKIRDRAEVALVEAAPALAAIDPDSLREQLTAMIAARKGWPALKPDTFEASVASRRFRDIAASLAAVDAGWPERATGELLANADPRSQLAAALIIGGATAADPAMLASRLEALLTSKHHAVRAAADDALRRVIRLLPRAELDRLRALAETEGER